MGRRLALAAALVGGFALAGCSGESDDLPIPSGSVAIVGHMPISKATLDHWTEVEFVTDNDQTGQEPVPSGVVIRPGDYGTCIAHLRVVHRGEVPIDGVTRPQSASALRQECESRYRTVREHVLNILIVFGWYIEEGRQQGVSPSDAQVRKQYARFSRERFPKPGELQRYLRHTTENYDDELLRMKIDLLSTNLLNQELHRIGGGLSPKVRQALARWGKDFFKRWRAHTHCLHADIVPNCGDYMGPKPIDPRI
jgi:hypothetical protein